MTPEQHKKIWTKLENSREYILYFPAMIVYYIIYPIRVLIEDYRAWMNQREKDKIPSFYTWCDLYDMNAKAASAIVSCILGLITLGIGLVGVSACFALLAIIYFIAYIIS